MKSCLKPERLLQFLNDDLPEVELNEIADHIETCEVCQGTLESVSDDPELQSWNRHASSLPASFLRSCPAFMKHPVEEEAITGTFECRSATHDDLVFPKQTGAQDRYELIRVFAKGGLGRIWLARDKMLEREVAVKELLPEKARNPALIHRFLREARITGKLEHPNIVPVYDMGSQSKHGQPFYAMRRVGGQTLRDAIANYHRQRGGKQHTSVALQKLLRDFISVCNAISYAHSQDVIHRDLKPDNVLVGEHGEVIVLDWGLAKSGVESGATVTRNGGEDKPRDAESHGETQLGSVLGTPAYMSPEQAAGKVDQIDSLTDVYGLGAILFEILGGRPPHQGRSTDSLLSRITEGSTQRVREIDRGVPRGLDAICSKAMAEDPRARYASVQGLIDDIQRYLADEPVSVLQETMLERGSRWSRQHKTATVSSLVTVVAMALVGSMMLLATSAWEATRIAKKTANDAAKKMRIANDSNETTLQIAGVTSTDLNLQARDYEKALRTLSLAPLSRRGWEYFRLERELDRVPHIVGKLAGAVDQHEWPILASLLSSDGRTIVTSGIDGRVIVWDTTALSQASMGPTPSFELVSGSWSEQHLAWRSVAFPLRNETELAQDAVVQLAWIDDGKRIVGACLSGLGLIWDLHDPDAPPAQVCSLDRPLTAVAASVDGTEVMFGDEQGHVTRAGLVEQKWVCGETTELSDSPIMDILHTGSGLWIVGQSNGNVKSFRSPDKIVEDLTVPQPAWDLDYSTELNLLAIGCGDGATRTFKLAADGQLDAFTQYKLPARTESGPPHPIHRVQLSASRGQVFAGDDSGRLIVWDLEDSFPFLIRKDQSGTSVPHKFRDSLPQFLRKVVSSIHVMPDATTVLTTGHNTCVNQWDFSDSQAVTEFSVGYRLAATDSVPDDPSKPQILFDTAAPHLMWVATADGRLSLWDTRADSRQPSRLVDVIDGAGVKCLAYAKRAQFAATGAGRSIRFWKRAGQELTPFRQPIMHQWPLRNIALTADGHRLAAYDDHDNVVVWDLKTGVSKSISLANEGRSQEGEDHESAIAGLVAFNADGSRLAAAGPRQSLWILDAVSSHTSQGSLKLIKKAPLVNGEGGTALQWHPFDPDMLFAGDTIGRFAGRFVSRNQDTRGSTHFKTGVAALTFSPTGDRVVGVDRQGVVKVVDPIWVEAALLERSSNHATAENPPTSLVFDSTGRRLAVAHEDGMIQIWETESSPDHASAPVRRTWHAESIEQGPGAARIHASQRSAVLDNRDRLWILYSKVPEKTRQVVQIARLTGAAIRSDVLKEIDLSTARSYVDVQSSLALLVSGDRLWATLRRPRPDISPYSGQICGYSRTLLDSTESPWTEELLSEGAENFGFHLHLFKGPNDKPAAAHFSFAGFYLYGTYWADGRWKHDPIGRQGDGYSLSAAQAPDGTIHALFNPQRFDLDQSPSIYTVFRFPQRRGVSYEVVRREVFDGQKRRARIMVLPDARAVVGIDGTLAEKTESGWNIRQNVIPASAAPTNSFAYDPRGDRFYFAHTDSLGQAVFLTTVTNEQTTTEKVWENDERVLPKIGLVTLVDSRGLPVVIAFQPAEHGGWLRVFRANEDLPARP